jgi:exopolyphosphatase/pppGpp-phosphohydrolase
MVAVIDIGSNSVRLMLKNGSNKQKFLITTRLAEGKVNGALSKISMDRTANAVAVLFDKAIKNGAEEVFVFSMVCCWKLHRYSGLPGSVLVTAVL